MIKTAIMTWFQYYNYGTALQVTALSAVLRKMGCNPYVVDYKTDGKPVCIHRTGILKEGYQRLIQRLKDHPYHRYEDAKREKKFDEFLKKNIQFTKPCSILPELEDLNREYDAFVCGSDQIWAPFAFDSHYFLDFVRDEQRLIAYAPSIGLSSIEDKNIEKRIAELAARFRNISVREKSGADLVSKLIKRPVDTVLDPTFLLDGAEWMKMESKFAEKFEPYLLVYMLGKNEHYWKWIYKIAQKRKLKVKIIPVFLKDLNRIGCIKEAVGPSDFLSLIVHADLVCTDSFHGLAFSLNYNKQFCVFERFKKRDKTNQNSRIYNLLNTFQITGHLIENDENEIPESVFSEIDYSKVNSLLEIERNKSLRYLNKALRSVEKAVELKPGWKNIFQKSSLCCGCGACAVDCPTNAIRIVLNRDGFYCAELDENKCVSCSKCIKVCPFVSKDNLTEVKDAALYSYKDKNAEVLLKSSSGGMAFRIAEDALVNEKNVIGCIFDEKEHVARHIMLRPDQLDKLVLLQGSKYMQSNFVNVISEIKKINGGAVVIGTPCQIAGVRNMLGSRKDILLVDLICHGVPSYHLYRKYLEFLQSHKGMNTQGELKTVFRYKLKGWRDIYIYNENSEMSYSESQHKDPYFLAFEFGFCYSKGCYDCPWRDKSAADLRLGDYWHRKYEVDKTGVSMVAAFSETGRLYMERLMDQEFAIVKEQPIEDYLSCQQILNHHKPVFWEEFIDDLSSDVDLQEIINQYIEPFAQRRKIRRKLTQIKGVLCGNGQNKKI